MRARVLPPEEWGRLAGKGLDPLLPHLRPEDTRMVVVEDGDEIVAHLGVLKVTHLEGLWIDPSYRNAGVGRRLLREAMQCVRPWSSDWVMALAADEQIGGLVRRLGGVKIPVESFILSFGEN